MREFFGWLRGLVTPRRPNRKDTEANRLKEEVCRRVDEYKQASAAGDEQATLKLRSLKQHVAEQSDRLLGPKKLAGLMVICLALAVGGGCGGGLGAKTAKDIETAMEDPILPEYLSYVEADPKLKEQDKKEKKQKVAALRFVIKAAQK